MRYWCFFIELAVFLPWISVAQNLSDDTVKIPITKVFYGMDRNAFSSFEYNYGLNYIVAGIGTCGIVKSGFDW